MYFLRKRKQARDRDAGLVFVWRGARRHHSSKVLAIMLAVGICAFSVFAVRVEGPKPPLLSQRKGVVIMLNEGDAKSRFLMLQIEANSPFPVRWDPAFDTRTMDRLEKQLAKLSDDHPVYHPKLLPLPEQVVEDQLASILDLTQIPLENETHDLPLYDERSLPLSGDLKITAKITAQGVLGQRLSQEGLMIPEELMDDDVFGQTFPFLIALDSQGGVQSCIPLLGGSTGSATVTDLQDKLAAWLFRQRFKSGTQSVLSGSCLLHIKALRE